jgi:CDP-glucose 4,6-dehydratase
MPLMVDSAFWKERKVLITGHTGFMGGWLAVWLSHLGARVSGYSLPAPTDPSFYEVTAVPRVLDAETIADVRCRDDLMGAVRDASPEIVFHLAAQPLVRYAFDHPIETIEVNVMGSANLLDAVRSTNTTRVVLVITTDKVYENVEWDWDYRERDRLGGKEPYGASKACAEIVVDAYRASYLRRQNTAVSTIRAGNIIGGGDWAADRLIPDIVRAFSAREPLVLRNPSATRPWQHVLDPLRGYLILAQQMWLDPADFEGPWNFGPAAEDHRPVSWIADRCADVWGGEARWELDPNSQPYEAKRLGVTSAKAEARLGWRPVWRLDQALERSMGWYRAHLDGGNMLERTLDDIRMI